MPMNYTKCLVFASLISMLTACAPEIGVHMSVPNVPEPLSAVEPSAATAPIRVKVGRFADGRADTTIVAIDGREVESEGDLSAIVEEGFTRYLRQAGARIAILDAPTIEGTITEWRAKVEPSFPSSEAKASARLSVVVRDSRAHAIYNATFSGEATASHPLLDEDGVQKLLAQAMGSALEAAVKDEKFLAQISNGHIR